jgi:hypothetical protein
MLDRRRAATTGTPSMTTLPQGTWAALLHSVSSRRAIAALDVQDQITKASSPNATATRRFAGSSTASS